MGAEARRYLQEHSIPQLFEGLVIGLVHNKPEDPVGFIDSALTRLREEPQLANKWDAFVEMPPPPPPPPPPSSPPSPIKHHSIVPTTSSSSTITKRREREERVAAASKSPLPTPSSRRGSKSPKNSSHHSSSISRRKRREEEKGIDRGNLLLRDGARKKRDGGKGGRGTEAENRPPSSPHLRLLEAATTANKEEEENLVEGTSGGGATDAEKAKPALDQREPYHYDDDGKNRGYSVSGSRKHLCSSNTHRNSPYHLSRPRSTLAAPSTGDHRRSHLSPPGYVCQRSASVSRAADVARIPTDAPIILFMGGPGGGKTRYAARIREALEPHGLVHVCMPDLIRGAIARYRGEHLDWREAERRYQRGELIPNELALDLVRAEMGRHPLAKAYFLEGFPREVRQVELFEAGVRHVNMAMILDYDEDTLRRHMHNRGLLKEVIDRRIEEFKNKTLPSAKYFDDQRLLHLIPGEKDEQLIYARMYKLVTRAIRAGVDVLHEVAASSTTLTTPTPGEGSTADRWLEGAAGEKGGDAGGRRISVATSTQDIDEEEPAIDEYTTNKPANAASPTIIHTVETLPTTTVPKILPKHNNSTVTTNTNSHEKTPSVLQNHLSPLSPAPAPVTPVMEASAAQSASSTQQHQQSSPSPNSTKQLAANPNTAATTSNIPLPTKSGVFGAAAANNNKKKKKRKEIEGGEDPPNPSYSSLIPLAAASSLAKVKNNEGGGGEDGMANGGTNSNAVQLTSSPSPSSHPKPAAPSLPLQTAAAVGGGDGVVLANGPITKTSSFSTPGSKRSLGGRSSSGSGLVAAMVRLSRSDSSSVNEKNSSGGGFYSGSTGDVVGTTIEKETTTPSSNTTVGRAGVKSLNSKNGSRRRVGTADANVVAAANSSGGASVNAEASGGGAAAAPTRMNGSRRKPLTKAASVTSVPPNLRLLHTWGEEKEEVEGEESEDAEKKEKEEKSNSIDKQRKKQQKPRIGVMMGSKSAASPSTTRRNGFGTTTPPRPATGALGISGSSKALMKSDGSRDRVPAAPVGIVGGSHSRPTSTKLASPAQSSPNQSGPSTHQHHHSHPHRHTNYDIERFPSGAPAPNALVILVIGAPGANKTALARRIANNYPGFVHLSMGQLLRARVGEEAARKRMDNHEKEEGNVGSGAKEQKSKDFDAALWERIGAKMDAGEMVPARICRELLYTAMYDSTEGRMFSDPVSGLVENGPRGFVIEGYPRTLPQLENLEKHLGRLDLAILIDCTEQFCRVTVQLRRRKSLAATAAAQLPTEENDNHDAISSSSSSKIARATTSTTNTSTKPRADDEDPVVEARLALFKQHTLPMLRHLDAAHKLRVVRLGTKEFPPPPPPLLPTSPSSPSTSNHHHLPPVEVPFPSSSLFSSSNPHPHHQLSSSAPAMLGDGSNGGAEVNTRQGMGSTTTIRAAMAEAIDSVPATAAPLLAVAASCLNGGGGGESTSMVLDPHDPFRRHSEGDSGFGGGASTTTTTSTVATTSSAAAAGAASGKDFPQARSLHAAICEAIDRVPATAATTVAVAAALSIYQPANTTSNGGSGNNGGGGGGVDGAGGTDSWRGDYNNQPSTSTAIPPPSPSTPPTHSTHSISATAQTPTAIPTTSTAHEIAGDTANLDRVFVEIAAAIDNLIFVDADNKDDEAAKGYRITSNRSPPSNNAPSPRRG